MLPTERRDALQQIVGNIPAQLSQRGRCSAEGLLPRARWRRSHQLRVRTRTELGRHDDHERAQRRRQFERDLLIERTQSGLKRAKSEGKALGRPSTLSDKQKQDVRDDLTRGMSISAIAQKFVTSRQTITRVRDEGSRSVRT